MVPTRRLAIAAVVGSSLAAGQIPDAQEEGPQHERRSPFPDHDSDEKLPNGKSQKDAIAQEQHRQALKDAGRMFELAQQIKDELEKAGNFVVPLSTIKKTEEIEKLAHRIRGRLKG